MYCKNCFKKISSTSKFCRYCGEPVKKSKKKYIIIVLAVVLIIAAAAAAAVLVSQNLPKGADLTQYEEYAGTTWQEEGSTDVEMKGGARLEILSVDESSMQISFGIYAGGGSFNGVEVENVTAAAEDGKLVYSFADDGYGNSGKGSLSLEDGCIIWKSRINQEETKTFKLYKVVSEAADTQTENMEE